jgi:plasmid stabilization system protein ParE
MKLRTVRVLRRAERDLQNIYDLVARELPLRADSFIDELLAKIEHLRAMSERGSQPRDPTLRRRGYRYLVHGRYVIFYKVSASRVTVHRILPGKVQYRAQL